MSKNLKISCILFLVIFCLGLLLAKNKPLWNDEIFSQTGVSNVTYVDFFLGKSVEGNNSPLFYVIQKVICDISDYEMPETWIRGNWNHKDSFSQILLRLQPVFFMSLAITCIFYYFTRFHSIFAGIYSLFISFTSFMVWVYWAEARPYALWFFLTTAQSLLFLYLMRVLWCINTWRALTAIHILMSFTVFFSIVQVAIVSGLLWIYHNKHWKDHIFMTFIPIAISLFYYINAPKYNFIFNISVEQLITNCFSRYNFYILFIYLVLSGFRLIKSGTNYAYLTILMLMSAAAIFIILKLNAHHEVAFSVQSRYFIYLTPISIIATTLFSINIFKFLKEGT